MEKQKRYLKSICNGRYRDLELKGGGAMGQVFEATDRESGKKVALKMVPRSVSDIADRMKELRENYDRIEGLHHPNIVAVKHLLKIPELEEYALMMEYVPGPNLLNYRKRQEGRRIRLSQAVRFAGEMAAGLDYAHRRGIVHRDIKPDNIIITQDNEAKIADFGIARRIDTVAAVPGEHFQKEISGTYDYMAPEIWRGEPADAASDIYSLGAVVYEMISGHPPFEAPDLFRQEQIVQKYEPRSLLEYFPENPDEKNEARRKENEKIRKAIEKIDPVIRKALAKSRQDRYPSAGQFAEDLKDALDSVINEPDPAPPPPKKTGLALAALLALAILVPSALYLFKWYSQPSAAARIEKLAPEIIGDVRDDPMEMALAEGSISLMAQLCRKRKLFFSDMAVFGFREVEHGIGCPDLTIAMREKITANILQRIDPRLGVHFNVSARPGGGQLETLEDEFLNSRGGKGVEDLSEMDLLPKADILISGTWNVKKDHFELYLAAYEMSRPWFGEKTKFYERGRWEGKIPKAGRDEGILHCLEPSAVHDPRFQERKAFENPKTVTSEPEKNPVDLRVKTSPEGATIFVNGERRDGKSPMTVKNILPGPVKVRAEMADFEAAEKSLNLVGGEENEVEFRLKRENTRLYVETNPANAQINLPEIDKPYEDGMPLKTGKSYTIKVAAPGYKTREQVVTAEQKPEKRITVTLEKEGPRQGDVIESEVVAGMKFVFIPPGDFQMGSSENEKGHDPDESPRHPVKIKRGFYLQTTEVTQAQWKKVMESNPSVFQDCGSDCPVENVSWKDVKYFIEKLNGMEQGIEYRLPTEAEWEYAARAESTTAFANGDITETVCKKIPICMPWGGTVIMLTAKPIRWRTKRRTSGTFMICTVMFGSGLKTTIMRITIVPRMMAPHGSTTPGVRAGSFVAGPGTSTLPTVVPPTGTGTGPTSPTPTSAFGLPPSQNKSHGREQEKESRKAGRWQIESERCVGRADCQAGGASGNRAPDASFAGLHVAEAKL